MAIRNRCIGVYNMAAVRSYLNLQIYLQLYGLAFTTAWTAVMTVVIYGIVNKLCRGMRVPEEHEKIGLDIASHNETILAMPKKKLAALIKACDAASSKERGQEQEGGDWDLDVMNHGDKDNRDEGEEVEEAVEATLPYRNLSIILSDEDISTHSKEGQNDEYQNYEGDI